MLIEFYLALEMLENQVMYLLEQGLCPHRVRAYETFIQDFIKSNSGGRWRIPKGADRFLIQLNPKFELEVISDQTMNSGQVFVEYIVPAANPWAAEYVEQ